MITHKRGSQGRALAIWIGLLAGTLLPSAAVLLDDDVASARLAAVALCIAMLSMLRLSNLRPLGPAMIYVFVFAIFHLGSVVLWGFGFEPEVTPRWLLIYRLTPAITLTILAITSFQVGTAWASREGSPQAGAVVSSPAGDAVIFHCGVAIFAIGLAALAVGVSRLGWDRLVNATYFETYRLQQHSDPRFFVTSLFVVPIGLYLATAAGPWRRLLPVSVVGLLWASALFYLGFRGFALIPLVTVLAILVKRGLTLPRWVYVAGISTLLVLISSVRVLRDSRLSDRGSWAGLTFEAPTSSLHELGGSILPLVHTLRLMQTEDYRWGRTYWRALGEIVPNVTLEWEAERFVPTEELPPSHWVTKLAAPWRYRNYGGLGFSAVAEPYMNFGIPAVVAFFLFLGWALVRAEHWGAAGPHAIAAWAIVLGPLLWTTRNASLVFFRPAVWGLLALAIAILISRSIRRPKRFPYYAPQNWRRLASTPGHALIGSRRVRRAESAPARNLVSRPSSS